MQEKQKSKSTKKNQRTQKFLLYGITLLISCCIIAALIIKIYPREDYYKPEDRTSKIEATKKKDKESYSTIGWLRVQGTNIDLPVIGYHDKKEPVPVELGSYVWNFDDKEKYHNKINIMGHNIMNLSSHPEIGLESFHRFEDLMAFTYYDFAKENKYIQYTIDGKDYLYKIFSVYFESAYKVDLYKRGDHTESEKEELIERYKEKSIYKYDIDVNKKDDLISLMTCTRFYGTDRYVTFMVNGRLVRDNEKIDDYKVEEKKEYQKVKKILKGDENNETA